MYKYLLLSVKKCHCKTHNKARNPLGRNLFPKRSIMRPTMSINYVKAIQLVPGNKTLAANLMARAWNSSSELQSANHHQSSKISSPEVGSKPTHRNLRLLVFGHYLFVCQTFPEWEGKNNSSYQIKSIYNITIYLATI